MIFAKNPLNGWKKLTRTQLDKCGSCKKELNLCVSSQRVFELGFKSEAVSVVSNEVIITCITPLALPPSSRRYPVHPVWSHLWHFRVSEVVTDNTETPLSPALCVCVGVCVSWVWVVRLSSWFLSPLPLWCHNFLSLNDGSQRGLPRYSTVWVSVCVCVQSNLTVSWSWCCIFSWLIQCDTHTHTHTLWTTDNMPGRRTQTALWYEIESEYCCMYSGCHRTKHANCKHK